MFAPALKSDTNATERSIITGILRLTGPNEPTPAPILALITASSANSNGEATSGNFSALISFNSWSPRITNATNGCSSLAPFTIKVLTVFSIGKLNCSTNSAIVFAFGVSTNSIAFVGAARSPIATASANSMFAA